MTKDEMTDLYALLVQQQSQILHLTQQVKALELCLQDRESTFQTSYRIQLQEIQKQQRDQDKKTSPEANSGPGSLLRELQNKLARLSNPEG